MPGPTISTLSICSRDRLPAARLVEIYQHALGAIQRRSRIDHQGVVYSALNGDPDIPIYEQAKAEYAKLQ